MSGLVSFFKDFFPNVQNIDYNRRLEDLTADEKGVAVPPAAKKADTNQSAQPQVQPQVQQQHEQLIQALSKPPPRSNVQFTPDLVTFREWRQYSKESLKAFYLRRFVTEEDDQEDNGGSSGDQEEEEDKDEADVWESDVEIQDEDDENDETAETIEPRQQQGKGADDGGNELALESQPPPQAPNDEQEQANTSPRNIKKSAKRRIPPLYQAIHSIQTLEYLDLRTKDLSLDLCSVNKVWRLRETRRGLAYLHSATKGEYQTRCCVFPGRMPRVLFGHLQDDGPMSSIYDYVLSLEVQQLLPTPRRVSPHGGVPRKAVVRIFLYNAYAKAVSEWMDEQSIRRGEDSSKRAGDAGASSNKNGFILSLSKIPALSIFPYALDPRDWWDQEHVVHHCVCLGDSSAMMATRHMDGTTEQVRADSDDMELRLAVAGAGVEASAASELVVSKSMLSGPPEEAGDDDDYLLEPNPLVETWKQYLESKKPPASTQAPAVTTATAKVTTQHNTAILGPPAPIAPVMPNFSTAVSSAQTNEPIPAAPPVEPGILVPPNRPPPPSPVHRPVETMTFEGSARKRPRINDVTNLPNRTAAAATTYSSLASLKSLYDSNRREDGRGVINPNLTVNTYGVVMGFTAPNQTKRGDWMVECNLVDETCTVPVTAVIFTKSNLELPKFQRMGDVLRLHRVHLQIWKGDVQLTGKRHTSFVVIRKTAGTALTDVATRTATSQVTEETKTNSTAGWHVLPTARNEYSFEESDEERSQNLWHWGQTLLREQPTMIQTEHRFTIADLGNLTDQDEEKRRDRDLTVMVTAQIPFLAEALTAITPQGFLRVWDGTGQVPSDPLPIPTLEAKETQRTGDPPAAALTRIASIVQQLKTDSAHVGDAAMKAMETPESLCGKVANAVIWETAHWELVTKHVPVGSFIRLRNVDVLPWKEQPFRSFMVHPKSWLSPLPDETYEIRTLLLDHDRRVKNREYNPMSGLLPLAGEHGSNRPNNPERRAIPPLRVVAETAATPVAPTQPHSLAGLQVGDGLAEFATKAQDSPQADEGDGPRRRKKRRKDIDIYKGFVRLLEPTIPAFTGNLQVFCSNVSPTTCSYRLVLTISDKSKSLNVIVASPVADKIFGVPAKDAVWGGHWKQPPLFDSTQLWNVTLRGVHKNGQRYFVMTDIEKCSTASQSTSV